jgi:exonuclease V
VSREDAPAETAAPSPRPSLSLVDESCTPLQRFRTKPRKPLSVTDLVSPVWCELQYFYNLSKFGRKPPTQAMKTGSKIHQALEDEVHTVVPVRTKTNEDRFGLRIWNAIQGLRGLRETGLARELQVWGVIGGQVVNGIIDELSFTCPDPDFEEKHELSKAEKSGGTPPLGQWSIQQAFAKASATTSLKETDDPWVGAIEPDRQVYIADVKTRGVRSLPSGPALRPIWMQLMLYRRLLESLSLNIVDAETVFERYNLAPLNTFSEVFMLEVGALNHDHMKADPLQTDELRSHPNLLSLWSLMISEYQQTMPSISDILRAEFRYSRTGDIIGNELVVYSTDTIDKFVKEEMEWWNGIREPKGVDVEEAFKCRTCDFADECSWRKTKIEEATEKHRLRKSKSGKSDV